MSSFFTSSNGSNTTPVIGLLFEDPPFAAAQTITDGGETEEDDSLEPLKLSPEPTVAPFRKKIVAGALRSMISKRDKETQRVLKRVIKGQMESRFVCVCVCH